MFLWRNLKPATIVAVAVAAGLKAGTTLNTAVKAGDAEPAKPAEAIASADGAARAALVGP